uniref:Galectin n=1 Tax=Mola mola TaxID=94237 RepID=A0A3Q3XJF9_MOLML
ASEGLHSRLRSSPQLREALDGWPGGSSNQAGAGGPWPGPPTNPQWPSQPNPVWPGGSSEGGMWPSSGPGHGPGQFPSAPQQDLTVPYKQNLPNGVYDKLLITIAGTVKPNADKITLDFGTSRDIAFHFNPRFSEGGSKVIVRNSFINNQWGPEERELQQFPFVQGQQFELKILCTNSEFKVAFNNNHLLSYKHRIYNLRSINSLHIYNDLTLSRIHMETMP